MFSYFLVDSNKLNKKQPGRAKAADSNLNLCKCEFLPFFKMCIVLVCSLSEAQVVTTGKYYPD